MDSDKPLGWSGQLDWPPASEPHGRRRRTDAAGGSRAHSTRRVDPLTDTNPIGGLHKFNLGMVPASVTPPRTWRRAAWFAIVSSAAALGGLVFVAAILSDGTTTIKGMDRPSVPRGGEHPPVRSPSPTPSRPSTSQFSNLLGITDTEAMKRRANEYYAAISRGDLRHAYGMTTGPLRAEGYKRFATRYAHATSVEVVDVSITPTSTVHIVRLTKSDGSVSTQRRELRFTPDDDPLIMSDKRIS